MRIFGKPTARQKEIRRTRAERGLTWRHRLAEQLQFQPITFLLFCGLVTAWIVLSGQDRLGLSVRQRVPRDVTARVTFRLVDERATDRMRALARDNAPDYYTLDTALLQDIQGRLMTALRIAREHATDPQKLREKAAEIKVMFDDAGASEIARLADLADATDFQLAVDRAIRGLSRQPFVEATDLAHRRTGISAVLVDPLTASERTLAASDLLYASNPEHLQKVVQTATDAGTFSPALTNTIRASLVAMLQDGVAETAARPLFLYDTRLSAKAAQDAESRVAIQYNVFAAGTRLADAGPLTEAELELLTAEQRNYLAPELGLQDEQSLALLQIARERDLWAGWARALVAFLLVLGIGGYIVLAYERLLGGPRRRLATGLTLLFIALAARAIYLQTPHVHLTVGLFAFAAMLLAITTATNGPAYAAAGLLALVLALATRQSVTYVAVLVCVGLALFLGLRDVRNRGRIIAIGGLAAGIALLLTQLAGLVHGQSPTFVFWNQAIWAGLTTLAAAFIVEGILPGIERLFGITTNMTLLEWCDPNKPLLRMLAAESPGTYNHSLLVGTLADAAAEAIGANGLLARAGAYYHDIGKINKPEYFVENQALGMGNRHERLSPAMSHLIIVGHVKDGIEMAREYGLPESLHRFIPEHHGTSVVEYFYHAANKARKPGDPEISAEQFRYPGPKPRSRETAIVMICDGVEGAVRSMTEPTPNRIEDTVDKIIEKRQMDGQFDDCDMTFRELHTIRNSLVKSLSAIYHGRIVYPSEREGEGEPPAGPATKSAS
jgi:putative nucleotidyltransferase with HDIG domain